MRINETFVDGVGNLAVQGALTRIELTQLAKLPASGEQPSYQVSQRLVMGVETMLRLHQALDEVVKQLEEKGVVKKSKDKASAPKTASNSQTK